MRVWLRRIPGRRQTAAAGTTLWVRYRSRDAMMDPLCTAGKHLTRITFPPYSGLSRDTIGSNTLNRCLKARLERGFGNLSPPSPPELRLEPGLSISLQVRPELSRGRVTPGRFLLGLDLPGLHTNIACDPK